MLPGIPSLTKCFVHLFKVYRTKSEMAMIQMVSAQGGLSSHQDRIKKGTNEGLRLSSKGII